MLSLGRTGRSSRKGNFFWLAITCMRRSRDGKDPGVLRPQVREGNAVGGEWLPAGRCSRLRLVLFGSYLFGLFLYRCLGFLLFGSFLFGLFLYRCLRFFLALLRSVLLFG